MCFSKPDPVTVTQAAPVAAPAPAPALPPADAPKIGESRRKETFDNFGDDAPQYRTNRNRKAKPAASNKTIRM